jgi:glutamate/tyrosine decarboxylase-like PLP-dependent enzyme
MSTNMKTFNGGDVPLSDRATEVKELLALATERLIPFISSADSPSGKVVVEPLPPKELEKAFDLALPDGEGRGREGLDHVLEKVLRYSVNTWNQGFMDKLFSTTDPVGVASDLVLSVLNTNVHVYQVSPALTIIERETAQKLARLFGFNGPHAGGLTFPGGSSSNATSMLIARHTLFPATKQKGNDTYRFAVFSSSHGHYSIEKAATLLGFGSEAVQYVDVDREGRMITSDLESKIIKAKLEGFTPLWVNAGAGTTVMGSYDPFNEIADICQRHRLWFHVDGSWGGAVAFSRNQNWRLKGVERADSVTMNPHKMLNVPSTCSFLVMPDRRKIHRATSLKAGYLFHEDKDTPDDVYDMAQLTMGCGRRADSLKMAFGWIYYGREGYERRIDHAFSIASYFATALSKRPGFHLISSNPPPGLQVCFYYIGHAQTLSKDAAANTAFTRRIAKKLIERGFMIDYSPDKVHGEFFRAVVNSGTSKEKVDELIDAVEALGRAEERGSNL